MKRFFDMQKKRLQTLGGGPIYYPFECPNTLDLCSKLSMVLLTAVRLDELGFSPHACLSNTISSCAHKS